jgi:hypothetical protein
MINVTILDTNDNAPIFQQSEYTISIPENQPIGTTVLKVTAYYKELEQFLVMFLYRMPLLQTGTLGPFQNQ